MVQAEKSNCLIRRKKGAVGCCGVFWLSSYRLPASMIWVGQPQNDLPAAKVRWRLWKKCKHVLVEQRRRRVVSDTGFISLQVLRSKYRPGGNQLGSTAANPSILGSKQ